MCLYLNFVFTITRKHFCYDWLGIYPWLAYSPIRDSAYSLFCVFFCHKVVTRKKKLVHLPYSDWSDAQAQFKRHVNAISGNHRGPMKNYSNFLNEMAGKVERPMFKLFQKMKKPRKTT